MSLSGNTRCCAGEAEAGRTTVPLFVHLTNKMEEVLLPSSKKSDLHQFSAGSVNTSWTEHLPSRDEGSSRQAV